jgi:hypothetical protein
MIKFNKNNRVSCDNTPIGKILFEYICWVLSGKPQNHKINQKK